MAQEPEAAAAKLARFSSRGSPVLVGLVPLYKREAYLKRCLDCVLEQDPGPDEMEILVVDDAVQATFRAGSRDRRGRVRYLRNASNLGLYPSTNAAIEMTSGRFIHILHDDDWVENGFYRKMREAIEACPDTLGSPSASTRRSTSVRPNLVAAALSRHRRAMDRNFLIRLATECPLNCPRSSSPARHSSGSGSSAPISR